MYQWIVLLSLMVGSGACTANHEKASSVENLRFVLSEEQFSVGLIDVALAELEPSETVTLELVLFNALTDTLRLSYWDTCLILSAQYIAPQTSLPLTLHFDPSLEGGRFYKQYVLDFGRGGNIALLLHGRVAHPAKPIKIIEFGQRDIQLGELSDSLKVIERVLSFRNIAPFPIRILDVKTNGGGAVAQCKQKQLLPGATGQIIFKQYLRNRKQFHTPVILKGVVEACTKKAFSESVRFHGKVR